MKNWFQSLLSQTQLFVPLRRARRLQPRGAFVAAAAGGDHAARSRGALSVVVRVRRGSLRAVGGLYKFANPFDPWRLNATRFQHLTLEPEM